MIVQQRHRDGLNAALRQDYLLPVRISRPRTAISWKWVALIMVAFLVMGALL